MSRLQRDCWQMIIGVSHVVCVLPVGRASPALQIQLQHNRFNLFSYREGIPASKRPMLEGRPHQQTILIATAPKSVALEFLIHHSVARQMPLGGKHQHLRHPHPPLKQFGWALQRGKANHARPVQQNAANLIDVFKHSARNPHPLRIIPLKLSPSEASGLAHSLGLRPSGDDTNTRVYRSITPESLSHLRFEFATTLPFRRLTFHPTRSSGDAKSYFFPSFLSTNLARDHQVVSAFGSITRFSDELLSPHRQLPAKVRLYKMRCGSLFELIQPL